jgi:hypothetical protein
MLRAALVLLLVYPPPTKDTKADADKPARELGDAFVANMAKKDYDAVLKTVELPYKLSDGTMATKAEEVKREVTGIVAALWSDGTTAEVKDVVAADKFAAWAAALPMKPESAKTDAAAKAVIEHVGTGGRIVALQFTIDGKKDDDLALLLVKVKDGKATLVGVVD